MLKIIPTKILERLLKVCAIRNTKFSDFLDLHSFDYILIDFTSQTKYWHHVSLTNFHR